ncbi:HWE histidine kinase domain-containing protein [Novosphingobium terrae]|uniref:HWE histidine kinase domain-containing protein n=1 Tax=Novosphingobium terrae TaxID=2726189 RepID=UPI0019825A84|nr:HWE histidine kinase domain-containing protein [Novosphingobium terrae]
MRETQPQHDHQGDLETIDGIELLPSILEAVCRVTSSGFAAVARVTETRWIACATRDEIGFGLAAGGELPLETTICHEIRQHRQAVIIDDVAADPTYREHHTPRIYGLGSYISVPITLPDGTFFGTLCAIDPQPRSLANKEVTSAFAIFADLIAQHLMASRQVATIRAMAHERERLIAELQTARDNAVGELERVSVLFDHAPSFMAVLDGPEHRFVSANPAYRDLIGGREVIGRTVAEALPEAAEQGFVDILDKVYATGEPFSMRGARFTSRDENGEAAPERFLDFLYQPVAGNDGTNGIVVIGYDVTDHVLQTRRQAALTDLGEQLRVIDDRGDITHAAARIMAEALGATRAGFGTVDAEHETVIMHSNWCAAGATPVEGTYRFREYGSFIDDLKRGETVIVADVREDPRTRPNAAAMEALGIRVLLNFPVIEHDQFVLVAFVHMDTLRELSEADIQFVKQVADRTQLALAQLQAKEQQETLNRELGHRMKNALSVVQAIVSQTLRRAGDLKAGRSAIDARLAALGRAHDMLTEASWKEADIRQVVEAALAAHRRDGQRISIQGPAVPLNADQVQGISMALYELATNATKYGALSNEEGRVALDWSWIDGAFNLTWIESGGPAVKEPSDRGLGSRLIEQAIAPYFRGKGNMEFAPEGLRFRLSGYVIA